MTDTFTNNDNQINPGSRQFAITPDDDNDLPFVTRALYCRADGDVVVRDEAGTDLPYTMVQGDYLPFRAVRILSTGTTATVYGWY